MTVRTSMTGLVNRLRSVTGAALDDVFQGLTFWSDEQLQEELDKFRYDVWAESLTAVPRLVSGSTVYLQFQFEIPRGFWLEDSFTVRDTSGNAVTTPAYTVQVNDRSGTVTFESSVGNRELFIDLSVIDWNAAAASVWEQKAAHRYDYINMKAGDHKFNAREEYETCVERARWHASRKIKSFHMAKRGFVAANKQAR